MKNSKSLLAILVLMFGASTMSSCQKTKTTEKAQNKEELITLEKLYLEKQEELKRLYIKLEVIRTRETMIVNLVNYQSEHAI